MNINKEKLSKYFLIGIGFWIVGVYMMNLFIEQPKFNKKGKYTIGYIYKYRKRLKGADISYYKYRVRNKMLYSSSVYGEAEKNLHKRFLVKYVESEEDLSYLLLKYPVPDSVKSAPANGWKELPEWAKSNRK